MFKKILIFACLITIISVLRLFVYKKYTPVFPKELISSYQEKIDAKKDLIKVTNIKAGDVITNPFVIEGEARGNWYFEASFPIELKDADENVLLLEPVQAKEEWMTTDFVTFSQEFYFEKEPTTSTGFLILKKDNPSGLPEHDDKIEIPVRFR